MVSGLHTRHGSRRTRDVGAARVPLVGLTLVLVGLAVALIFWLRRESTDIETRAVASTPSTEVHSSALDSDPSHRSERESEVLGDPSTTSSLPIRVDEDHAEIRGRFVSTDASPVARVPIELTTAAANGARASSHDGAGAEGQAKAMSNERGRFSIVFVPLRAAKYDMNATPESLCPLRWRWERIDRGERIDLGDIVLSRGGSITGRVLDPDGRPIAGTAWTVNADQPLLGVATRRSTVHVSVRTDATGAFELRDVPPGPTHLRVDRDGTSPFAGPDVNVHSGEVLHVDLKCPDPTAVTRISVLVSCPPYVTGLHACMNPSQVDAILLSGVVRTLAADPSKGSTRAFTFDGLAPGTYSLRVEDPRYLPWSMDGVAPGSVVEARLKGSASVRLALTDAASSAPITRCSVHAEVDDPQWIRSVSSFVPLREDCDLSLTSGLVDGLLPIDQTLIVSAPGYADSYVHDAPLNAGEVRAVSVRMSRGATLSGRVLESDHRTPAKHATVRLELPIAGADSPSTLLEDSNSVLATTTDTDGRFSFDRLRPGVHRVQASSSRAIYSSISEVRIAGDERPTGIEIILPTSTRLRGRILAPAGASFSEVRLSLTCKAFPLTEGDFIPFPEWRQRLAISIEPDGRFESGPLPIGEAYARLLTPDSDVPWSFGAAWHTDGTPIDLGTLVLSPAEWNEHDFDMHASFPGTIRVALDLNRASPDCVVTACTFQAGNMSIAAGAVMERDDVRIGPIAPGDYVIVVRALDATWMWASPTSIHVNAGEESSQRYRIALFDGDVKLRVAGDPASDFSKGVSIRLESMMPLPKFEMYPDAHGNLRLVLPAGHYSIRNLAPPPTRPADSTSANGAAPPSSPSVLFDWPVANDRPAEIVFPSTDG
jgi:hypothetical protein